MAIYVDIGIAAILLISIIVGAIRGMAKQIGRGLCALIVIIGSVYLTLLLVPILQKTGIFKNFAELAAGWFKGDAFTTAITSEEVLLEAMSGGLLGMLSKQSPRIWAAMVANEMSTLGAYFGDLCARPIVGIVLWIVLIVLLSILLACVRKLITKLSKLPVMRVFDKIFGAIWSLGIAYLVLVCIIMTAAEIAIVRWLPGHNVLNTLNSIIDKSYIFKFLHKTNILGAYIARLFGVDLSAMGLA